MSSREIDHKSKRAHHLHFHSFPSSPMSNGAIKEIAVVETVPRTHRGSSTANVEIQLDAPKTLGVSKRAKHRTWGKSASSSFVQLLEKASNWIFVLLLLVALALSAISLTQDDERWLKSDADDSEARVGWRAACIDQEEATDIRQMIVPCRSGDSTQNIDDIVTPTAGKVGKAILIVSIISWLCPLALMIGAFCLDCRRNGSCHGWLIALLWAISGAVLIGLAFWFRWIVNDHLSDLTAVKLSVTCSESNGEISVCDDVDSLSECTAQCRMIGTEDVVCTDYSDCTLSERTATCDLDGVGCELSIGCAMLASIGSSGLMIILAFFQAVGSWRLSKDL